MSAKMFRSEPSDSEPKNSHHKTLDSKIPIPSSPTPFRRLGSLRLKGEKVFKKDPNNMREGQERTTGKAVESNRQCASNPPLKRGNSYMERGEKRDDGGKTGPHRPNSVRITAAKSAAQGANHIAGSGRVRSLSLSLSSTKLNSQKSPSLSIASPTANSISPGTIKKYSSSQLDTWDTDSITSIGSSVASCDHASVARNGTTFSGRSMKYVFHCSQHAGASGEDYLTPTQRAHRQVKKLKYLLHQARKDLEQKDSDILKLTKEVVELRLYKAALNSPEDKSNSSDAVTVRENTSEEASPELIDTTHIPGELNSSFADSGHFEDGTNSSIHSNDDYNRSPYKSRSIETSEKGCTAHMGILDRSSEQSKLIMEYEKRIQELVRMHEEETYHLKQKHNDKVEELLQRITEINARYWELVPELDAAKERIKELELQLEEASRKLEEQEDKAKQTYLQMYSQGQAAARLEQENAVMEIARHHPTRVSVPELLNELQITKNELENIKAMYRQLMEAKNRNKIDPEITLQFLKSAIYYFLTDKENSHGHLKAIQSILGFTPSEIANIDKARTA
ncbi:protein quick-to-court isoform X2 [Anthonomus grandis grandis]|uniref:protein quick-to-court isoform X2 n=1 Tax=Anthonomus grandis grandis TaxID=2921223 RepID=UPI002166454F|nr:protein quick-to-court isoform X2 [Anthonomus grandis grandis]